jgi:hypothetical protein
MKESTFELSILEAINCDVVDKYMDIFNQKQKANPNVLEEKLEKFLKCNEDLNNMTDDESVSSGNEEYYVEVDDDAEVFSDDDYISDQLLNSKY